MRKFALSVFAVLALGCTDDAAAPLTSPAQPTEGSVAFVQLSDVNPAAGSTVVVTVHVRGAAGVTNVGAFSARLQFDAAALEYAGESELSGGMRMLKPKSGEVLAAGASPDGFTDGTLFAVAFKVRDPAALRSLHLEVSELTGVDFGAQVSRLAIDRRLFAR
jgi:hypothetical protein